MMNLNLFVTSSLTYLVDGITKSFSFAASFGKILFCVIKVGSIIYEINRGLRIVIILVARNNIILGSGIL